MKTSMVLYNELDESSSAKLRQVHDYCESVLPHIAAFHPFFTLHDIRHSLGIISLIERFFICLDLLGFSVVKPKINSAEISRLLQAAYLHDIGMIYVEDDDLIACPHLGDQLSARIRKNHEIRSTKFIKKYLTTLLNFDELEDISLICSAHRGTPIHDNTEIKTRKDRSYQANLIRVELLSAILRLTDELDLTNTRAPRDLFNLMYNSGLMPSNAYIHWLRHSTVQFIDFRRSETISGKPLCLIDYAIEAPDQDYFQWLLPILAGGLNKEIIALNRIFEKFGFEIQFGNFSHITRDIGVIHQDKLLKFHPKLNIGYIDDEPEEYEKIDNLLNHALNDWFSLNASDSLSGLGEINNYQLILLDLIIHGNTKKGFEYLSQIRKRNRDIPIIIISKINQADAIVGEGIDKGANSYIYKITPNYFDVFKNKVTKAIREYYFKQICR
jgi:response regulator RpfG family c-di-GMP phosphodiesterase